MGMKGEVVFQVGGREHISVQCEGFTGHELHKSFAEMPHQPLLQ